MAALIEAGASVYSHAEDETPLFVATVHGNLNAVREFLRGKANPLLATMASVEASVPVGRGGAGWPLERGTRADQPLWNQGLCR